MAGCILSIYSVLKKAYSALKKKAYLASSTPDNDRRQAPQYYCQRCANHQEYFPRNGHNPACRYAQCTCELCIMVEQRRLLNPRKLELGAAASEGKAAASKGPKKCEPKCAVCQAHGVVASLCGHKNKECPFDQSEVYTAPPYSADNPHVHPCERCLIVKQRRGVMAQQIKARRRQKNQRMIGLEKP